MEKSNKIIICKITRKFLRASLLWPSEKTELNPGLAYKLTICLYFLLTGMTNLPFLIYFYLMFTKYKEINPSEEASIFTAMFGSFYLISAFIYQQHKLALLLRDLSNFDKFGKPPNFEEINKKLNLCAKILYGYTAMALFLYCLKRLQEKPTCQKLNEKVNFKGSACGFAVSMWLPFSVDFFPVFQIVYIYVFLTEYLLIKVCLQTSVTVLEVVHNIKLRINHFKLMMLECFESNDYHICKKKLNQCILYHIEILNFAKRTETIFYDCMFGHLTLTGIICACLEKQIVDNVNTDVAVIHLFGWIAGLFIACIAGQHHIDSNDIITEALWETKWYKSDKKLQKNVLFMIMRSQKNFYIRAGGFGVLSFPLFVSVLKMSYSMFCMLTSEKKS